MDRVEKLQTLAAFVAMALLFLAAMLAINLPAGRLMRGMLREVYAPRPVSLKTFKMYDGVQSCGWYVVSGDPQRWRYLNTREGLWAEGLSQAWRSQTSAAADLQDQWSRCMTQSGRGHATDGLMSPIVSAVLNAT